MSHCRAFDSFAPAHSAFGLPVYVARRPPAPFCETPGVSFTLNIRAIRGRVFFRPFVSISVYSSLLLLRREGRDDFFEARIAAERIPPGQQFQFAVADVTRQPGGDRQLFAR